MKIVLTGFFFLASLSGGFTSANAAPQFKEVSSYTYEKQMQTLLRSGQPNLFNGMTDSGEPCRMWVDVGSQKDPHWLKTWVPVEVNMETKNGNTFYHPIARRDLDSKFYIANSGSDYYFKMYTNVGGELAYMWSSVHIRLKNKLPFTKYTYEFKISHEQVRPNEAEPTHYKFASPVCSVKFNI
jgi:hypothetical protein